MERLTCSGTKEAKNNVTIREITERLTYYEDLEENGYMVILTLRPGDPYWEIESHFLADRKKCEGCEHFHEGDSIFRDDPCCCYEDKNDKAPVQCLEIKPYKIFSREQAAGIQESGKIGKTIFLDPNLAAEALRKLQERENAENKEELRKSE